VSAADKRVGFLVAGAQKAGTTALFDYLAEMPAVELPAIKEAHFFDDEQRVDWQAPDYAPYHALFADPARLWGEATPIYCYWPNALERIRTYNPAIKLILLFRDPVERAWSHWKMEYARGAETRPFAWSIREGRARLFEAEPWGFHREFSYVERGFYGAQLAAAVERFPRGQLLVLRAEDLRADPAATIGAVRAFLGLPAGPAPRPREVHVGADMDYGAELNADDVAHLRRIYARDQARLQALSGVSYG
jgi:hypothetical protein